MGRFKLVWLPLTLMLMLMIMFGSSLVYASDAQQETVITDWEMSWAHGVAPAAVNNVNFSDLKSMQWFSVHAGNQQPVPANVNAAWIKIRLPDINNPGSGLYIKEIVGQNLYAYIDDEEIYSSERSYAHSRRTLLLPLSPTDSNKELYFYLTGSQQKIMLSDMPKVGNYEKLGKEYLGSAFVDTVLGFSVTLLAVIMFFCLFFLNRVFRRAWAMLAIFILSIGLIIIADTIRPYIDSHSFGSLWHNLYDQAMNFLILSFVFYFELLFGKGPKSIITYFRKILIVIVSMFVIGFVISLFAKSRYYDYYYNITTLLIMLITLASFIVIGATLVAQCIKKNKHAIIILVGFMSFMLPCCAEVLWFFLQGQEHRLYYWKWGTLGLIFSLLYVLGSMIYENFQKVSEYARQLEVYNIELQKSGKMEVISQLAASVAHEVRNPLQVTRGFLQILGNKNIETKDKEYMSLAIKELDRAAEIINDFLSFAKPQMENMAELNLKDEFIHITGILTPLANLKNGRIDIQFEETLLVEGNSSKFKQAMINIIKNSIEALPAQGKIEICGYRHGEDIYVLITDNGIGMTDEELSQIGQPYFSRKENGTGLGLMVTFNIIELMGGIIKYDSLKGKGTQVTLQFPAVKPLSTASLK